MIRYIRLTEDNNHESSFLLLIIVRLSIKLHDHIYLYYFLHSTIIFFCCLDLSKAYQEFDL